MAEDTVASSPVGLDQAEIDTLLVPPAEASSEKALVVPAGAKGGGAPKIARYDFRNPSFLAEAELRRLRIMQEDFARFLSVRLSLYLKMEFGVKLADLTTISFAKFCESLPNPTHLTLFKIEPLTGAAILDINPRLALTVADRLLGGRGKAVTIDRYLTEIEVALIEDVVTIILEEWCAQWKKVQDLRPILMGHENNGRFFQTSPRDAVIVALTLEVTFGECTEKIQIGVPYYTIEPVVKKIQSSRQKVSTTGPVVKRAEWQTYYDRVKIPVRAEWEALELSLREIVSLRVGDVIEMPPDLCNETRILLNGTPKFIGTVGLDGDRVAVQVTRKISSEENSYGKPDGRKVT